MTREEIVRASKGEEGGMYIVIPSVVQLDTELPLSARMLYGIITWKCNKLAYTWASNRELGEALGVSGKRASALLSLLEKRGHIETEIERNPDTREIVRRYIYPIMKSSRGALRAGPPPENKDTPPPKCGYLPPEVGGPPPENEEVICNIKKGLENNIPPYSPPTGDKPGDDSLPEDKPAPKPRRQRFTPPDVEQVRAYCRERGNSIDPEAFVDYYTAKGWTVGKSPMKDWRAAVRTWEQRRRSQQKDNGSYWANDPEVST